MQWRLGCGLTDDLFLKGLHLSFRRRNVVEVGDVHFITAIVIGLDNAFSVIVGHHCALRLSGQWHVLGRPTNNSLAPHLGLVSLPRADDNTILGLR